jgi:hypothetical protein
LGAIEWRAAGEGFFVALLDEGVELVVRRTPELGLCGLIVLSARVFFTSRLRPVDFDPTTTDGRGCGFGATFSLFSPPPLVVGALLFLARLALFSLGAILGLPVIDGAGLALKVFFRSSSSFFARSSRCALSFAATASPGNAKVDTVGALADLAGTKAGLLVERGPLVTRFLARLGWVLTGELENDTVAFVDSIAGECLGMTVVDRDVDLSMAGCLVGLIVDTRPELVRGGAGLR